MGGNGRRGSSLNYLWGYTKRRWYSLTVGFGLLIAVVALLRMSRSLPDYGPNLSLNVVADLIGTIIVLFIVAPFLARGELRRDAVLERFDHGAFIRQTADARQRVHILELWTDLLQGSFRTPFLTALREALRSNVRVRILLLNPDARAAEQRADDLRQQTAVVQNILDNLRVLNQFVADLPDRDRANLEVRVYSALPPVQLYRVDDRAMVSFFPVNTTSWNAAQYQTSPNTQLGTFVGNKFDELWEAETTHTLAQFRAVTVTVDVEGPDRSYPVRFVTHRHEMFVDGQEIVTSHPSGGIDGLLARLEEANAKGEREVTGPYRLVPLNSTPADGEPVRELFDLKYGQDAPRVILKLTGPEAQRAPLVRHPSVDRLEAPHSEEKAW